MESKHRTFIAIAGTILSVFLLVFIASLFFLYGSVVQNEKEVRYTVSQGMSIKSVTNDLSSLKFIHHPLLFNLYIYVKRNEHELKAGEYLFPKGSTPASILYQITSGTGMLNHPFTIIAGWNFKHLREVLNREPNLIHTSAKMPDSSIMAYLGQPKMNPEGRFYPDTYYFSKGSSDLIVLKLAFKKMQNKLANAWQKRETDLPYRTPDEALTVASLIEKETPLNNERPVIAGVIVNRLKKNMFLQIDPTVIYAAGIHFNGTINKKELSMNNPYNTYRYKGLPPTPIAIPSEESLNAALHPLHHNYYYFVAKNNIPEYGHQFSTTLSEHETAVLNARDNLVKEFFNKNLINDYYLKTFFEGQFNAARAN